MKRHVRTIDRGPPEGVQAPGMLAIRTERALSENMRLLPNGNLLCMNVPVARAGWLIYGPGEIPVKAGANGRAYVERTVDTLFAASTLDAINTLAVTNDHPEDDVTPVNWRKLAGGFALNARRGEGDDRDIILADLMITDAAMIAEVQAGKREVSLGYDADYHDRGSGQGQQFNIVPNHIALVKSGRCGPRCAIGDEAYQPEDEEGSNHMATTSTRVKVRGTTRRTIDAQGLKELQDAATAANRALLAAAGGDDEDDDGQHIHLHISTGDAAAEEGTPSPADARVAKLEADVGALSSGMAEILAVLKGAPAKTADASPTLTMDSADEDLADDDKDDDKTKAHKAQCRADKAEKAGKGARTGDSAALETSYTALMGQAEILVPGFKVPTFDSAMTRAKTVDRMCALRRKVLDQFGGDASGKAILTGINGGKAPDLLDMDCVDVATLFSTAAVAKAAVNNATATRDAGRIPEKTGLVVSGAPKTPSLAEINAANAKHWENTFVRV